MWFVSRSSRRRRTTFLKRRSAKRATASFGTVRKVGTALRSSPEFGAAGDQARPSRECRTHHSRYIEANVAGLVVGCLYLPNGNPTPIPTFEYKLRWLNRLLAHAAELLLSAAPVVLARGLQRDTDRSGRVQA